MDFRKARNDSVDHNILGYKLQACDMTGSLLDWLLSYLTNRHRYQFVEIIGTKSDLRKVEYGVPRGSLVRPGLLQFTSDLFFQSTFTTRTTITSKEYKQKEAN